MKSYENLESLRKLRLPKTSFGNPRKSQDSLRTWTSQDLLGPPSSRAGRSVASWLESLWAPAHDTASSTLRPFSSRFLRFKKNLQCSKFSRFFYIFCQDFNQDFNRKLRSQEVLGGPRRPLQCSKLSRLFFLCNVIFSTSLAWITTRISIRKLGPGPRRSQEVLGRPFQVFPAIPGISGIVWTFVFFEVLASISIVISLGN